jgi:hypothetical protein
MSVIVHAIAGLIAFIFENFGDSILCRLVVRAPFGSRSERPAKRHPPSRCLRVITRAAWPVRAERAKKSGRESRSSLIVRTEGFEPPVSAFGGPRVIQLRYVRAPVFFGHRPWKASKSGSRYFGSSGESGAVVGMCLKRSSL